MIHFPFRNWTTAIAAGALGVVAFTAWPSAGDPVGPRRFDSEPTARISMTAASGTRAQPAEARRSTVVAIGDSITYLSNAAIHASLEPVHAVEVNGIPGIEVAGQQAAASQYARTQPDVVIINLGTNDVGAQRNPADVIGELGAMASEFGSASCVVFVTLTTQVVTDDFKQRATEVNRWIRNQRHVADWDSALTEADPLVRLTTDTVHPTAEGQLVMAQLIQRQVDACTV